MKRLTLVLLVFTFLVGPLNAQVETKVEKKKARRPTDPAGTAIRENRATPLERLKVAKGFRVELLHSVPAASQGSWVNLCVDNRGRVIASDQYGGLFRFQPPSPGEVLSPDAIEAIPAKIRAANGLLWAFDSLYVAVNDYDNKIDSGLYRLTDTDGDDRLDRVELLRSMSARGDHGVHAILPTPDGKGLYLITGNGTKPTEYSSSRVPTIWGEDHLLPRMPDGRGFMRDVLAPGGIVYRVTPDGQTFEVVASGFRNIFDGAINRDGELFTYDADMEYDFNTSWYRPTRVCHVVSGAEFGWRNGAGKRPEWYADNLPATINIGPGSPTGMTFGYGAKFPAKYQNALFILDWSWGKMYAVHLKPLGATYTAEKEEFLSGSPLPLTDAIIHPADGAMYLAIGGRKVQSGLYRITYAGPESTSSALAEPSTTPQREIRKRLESFHRPAAPEALASAWPHLASDDRFVRWAARTAIEHQPITTWADRAFRETDPPTKLEALLGLARSSGIDPFHRRDSDPPIDPTMRDSLLDSLDALPWEQLNAEQRRTLVRTFQIVLNRFGKPDESRTKRLLAKLEPHFPSGSWELNWLLCETLVFLQSDQVATKAISLIQKAPTQEEQIEYARSLRMLKNGWTQESRTAYFEWFLRASNYRGGASFEKFIEFIRTDAEANLSVTDRAMFKEILEAKPIRITPLEEFSKIFAGRERHEWTLDELANNANSKLKHRNFENGRKMFGASACFACHRFGNEGGMTGPDLTSAGRRYSARDLLDQILNPSKEINEQFVPIVVVTKDDETFRGVVVNLKGDTIILNTDGIDPNQRVNIDRKEVVSIEPSKISPMPTGLLAPLTVDEILDLTAYVLSGGDPKHELFIGR